MRQHHGTLGVFDSPAEASVALNRRLEKIANGTMTDRDWQSPPAQTVPSPADAAQARIDRIMAENATGCVRPEPKPWDDQRFSSIENEIRAYREWIGSQRAEIASLETTLGPKLKLLANAERGFDGIGKIVSAMAAAAEKAAEAESLSKLANRLPCNPRQPTSLS